VEWFERHSLNWGGTENILIDAGCLPVIQVLFDEDIKINIQLQNDRLWVWSPLSIQQDLLISNASLILATIIYPIDHLEAGQFILNEKENKYELRGLLKIDTVSHESLASVIKDLFVSVYEIRQTVS